MKIKLLCGFVISAMVSIGTNNDAFCKHRGAEKIMVVQSSKNNNVEWYRDAFAQQATVWNKFDKLKKSKRENTEAYVTQYKQNSSNLVKILARVYQNWQSDFDEMIFEQFSLDEKKTKAQRNTIEKDLKNISNVFKKMQISNQNTPNNKKLLSQKQEMIKAFLKICKDVKINKQDLINELNIKEGNSTKNSSKKEINTVDKKKKRNYSNRKSKSQEDNNEIKAEKSVLNTDQDDIEKSVDSPTVSSPIESTPAVNNIPLPPPPPAVTLPIKTATPIERGSDYAVINKVPSAPQKSMIEQIKEKRAKLNKVSSDSSNVTKEKEDTATQLAKVLAKRRSSIDKGDSQEPDENNNWDE